MLKGWQQQAVSSKQRQLPWRNQFYRVLANRVRLLEPGETAGIPEESVYHVPETWENSVATGFSQPWEPYHSQLPPPVSHLYWSQTCSLQAELLQAAGVAPHPAL